MRIRTGYANTDLPYHHPPVPTFASGVWPSLLLPTCADLAAV